MGIFDAFTVDGTTITFMASGASGSTQINITDNVGTLPGKIGAITGVNPGKLKWV